MEVLSYNEDEETRKENCDSFQLVTSHTYTGGLKTAPINPLHEPDDIKPVDETQNNVGRVLDYTGMQKIKLGSLNLAIQTSSSRSRSLASTSILKQSLRKFNESGKIHKVRKKKLVINPFAIIHLQKLSLKKLTSVQNDFIVLSYSEDKETRNYSTAESFKTSKKSNRSQNGNDSAEQNLSFDFPTSPGASNYKDLFESPVEPKALKLSTNTANDNTGTQNLCEKRDLSFDFPNSPGSNTDIEQEKIS